MKTPSLASRLLGSLAAVSGFVSIGPLSAQVSHTYTAPPPPGYPAPGAAPKQTSTRAARQSAAAIGAPATSYPAYPGTYPPPPGYTYPPPPGYGTAPVPKTAAKPATSTKSSSKHAASSKKKTAGPPPPAKVYGPTGDISTQVSRLRDSDKVQNLRIGELERDVSSIKRGGKSSGARYDGGTDLAAHTTYVARPGDTLFRIASTHRVSVGEIQQINRMTEDEVHVGQTLLIPSPHRFGSATTQVSYRPSTPGGASPSAPASSTMYHTVKKGDSLKGIALKHKMTISALAKANGIKNANKIFVGQRLKIPGRSSAVASSTSTRTTARESSDTVPLPGFGTAPTAPPPAAGLAPAPAPTPAAPAKPAVPNDSHRGILAYRVDRSDSIETIATQFSTTPERIREINRLDAATPLKTGDEIMVPAMGAVSVSSR